ADRDRGEGSAALAPSVAALAALSVDQNLRDAGGDEVGLRGAGVAEGRRGGCGRAPGPAWWADAGAVAVRVEPVARHAPKGVGLGHDIAPGVVRGSVRHRGVPAKRARVRGERLAGGRGGVAGP